MDIHMSVDVVKMITDFGSWCVVSGFVYATMKYIWRNHAEKK